MQHRTPPYSRTPQRPDRAAARGFTLIELVVVVVILGVLAAVAIPKYINLRTEAYKSAFGSTAGMFQSAVVSSQLLCNLRGWANRDNLVGLGNGTVDFSPLCWPTDTSNSNVATANAARCIRIFQGITTASYTLATTAATNPDYVVTVSAARCRFTFRKDTSIVRRFDYAPGTGTIVNLVNP